MSLVVQKFGGSSVATPEKLRKVAHRVLETRRPGTGVVVVVSAMGKRTDELLGLANQVTEDPAPRELDLLLASGEQVSSSLLAMAVQDLGEEAVALTGSQSGIVTTESHGGARVVDVRPQRILDELERGRIVIVAGFQGMNPSREITTLGRGGSDTSAVVLAHALGAEECQIFTDVDGVFSADPRIVPSARRIEEIGYEEMGALARHGARVVHIDAVELAHRYDVTIRVRSSFGGNGGTTIGSADEGAEPSTPVPDVRGVAGRTDLLGIAGAGEALEERVLERIVDVLGSERDVIPRDRDALTGPFSFLVASENIPDAERFAASLEKEIPAVKVATELGSVSAVGRDLGSRHEIRDRIRRALPAPHLDSFGCAVSVSCLMEARHVADAARTLHETFVEPAFAMAEAVA